MDKLLVREDIAKLLSKNQIGVELGVAEGGFSESLLKNTDDSFHLFSIDMWAGDRGHDVNQYNRCIKRLMPFKSRSSIIRSTFKNSLDIFPNDYFDFIYVDGYAHTGEENGQTFYDWWDKLKSGGVLAGDDYDRQVWNKVYTCVNMCTYTYIYR